MNSLYKFIERTILVLSIVGAVCLLAITVTIVLNVILRQAASSILGTVEVVQLVVVPMIAFALGYTAIKQGHVAVTLVTSHLSPAINKVLSIITIILSIATWAVIAWRSALVAWRAGLIPEVSDILEWPVAPVRWIMVLGIILLCVVLSLDLFKAIMEKTNK